ncbi:DUF6702 family protein [Hanstruepera ponticola]|uniref:DUF6702 family protein n=1 Tax=Hanstruepera ponticola TaxID=2042995 RepID=UPI000CF11C29|nr:DUF6702 family protein [Hanstruepera ponticola]
MNFLKKLFIVLVIPLFAFTAVHKYYVSVTQIEYVKEKASVQIISRIFIDDFEKLLRERYNPDITLSKDGESAEVDFYVEKYLGEKIKIKINGKDTDVVFIGKEYEADIMYCYLEIENVKSISSFEITNQVLFDLYGEQQNIVRTEINNKNKSFILIRENDKGLLNF